MKYSDLISFNPIEDVIQLTTADDANRAKEYGNTPCTGLGRLTGSGVEVETRSHKMVVLKDFANKDSLIERYGLLEYPK